MNGKVIGIAVGVVLTAGSAVAAWIFGKKKKERKGPPKVTDEEWERLGWKPPMPGDEVTDDHVPVVPVKEEFAPKAKHMEPVAPDALDMVDPEYERIHLTWYRSDKMLTDEDNHTISATMTLGSEVASALRNGDMNYFLTSPMAEYVHVQDHEQRKIFEIEIDDGYYLDTSEAEDDTE